LWLFLNIAASPTPPKKKEELNRQIARSSLNTIIQLWINSENDRSNWKTRGGLISAAIPVRVKIVPSHLASPSQGNNLRASAPNPKPRMAIDKIKKAKV
jgi:hypothetical protein